MAKLCWKLKWLVFFWDTVYMWCVQSKDKAANKVRQISGYIVFAAECRKDIQAEYPGSNFGEISRIVGNKVGVTLIFLHTEFSS